MHVGNVPDPKNRLTGAVIYQNFKLGCPSCSRDDRATVCNPDRWPSVIVKLRKWPVKWCDAPESMRIGPHLTPAFHSLSFSSAFIGISLHRLNRLAASPDWCCHYLLFLPPREIRGETLQVAGASAYEAGELALSRLRLGLLLLSLDYGNADISARFLAKWLAVSGTFKFFVIPMRS